MLAQQPEMGQAGTVAGYAAMGTEPPTEPVLDALLRRGVRVLLPVLRDDDDLDWAHYAGRDALTVGRHGIAQPRGPRLGVDAVAECDVVLCPALAVDAHGTRLGRGGGSYDRALPRLRAQTWTCALLFDGEVCDRLPHAHHDRPVHAAVTPSGVRRFRPV